MSARAFTKPSSRSRRPSRPENRSNKTANEKRDGRHFVPPHPVPLPKGEGESFPGFWIVQAQSLLRCHGARRSALGCSLSRRERVRVRGKPQPASVRSNISNGIDRHSSTSQIVNLKSPCPSTSLSIT